MRVNVNDVVYLNPTPDSLHGLGLSDNEVAEVMAVHGWALVRAKRDSLLSETDWCLGNDSPLAVEGGAGFLEAIVGYRKKLRSIPQDFDSPELVEWPEKPVINK